MTALLEFKEIVRRIYARYGTYILPAVKFLVELTALLLIKNSLGYNDKVSGIGITLILSLIACVLPAGFSILIPAIVILADFYALSMEVFLAGAAIMAIMALLYLRFSPKTGYMIVLTPILFAFHIPYAMPAAAGLLFGPSSAISVACGTFFYYFLHGISANAAVLSGGDEETTVLEKISAIIKQITGNREMLVVILVFVLMTILIYVFRRLSINHSWTIAIIVGFMSEFVILLGSYIALGLSNLLGFVVVGNIVCVGIAIVLKFLFFSVDYRRTEKVQFEDDDYYYYVKAVPKLQVLPEEKQIKKYSSTHQKRK